MSTNGPQLTPATGVSHVIQHRHKAICTLELKPSHQYGIHLKIIFLSEKHHRPDLTAITFKQGHRTSAVSIKQFLKLNGKTQGRLNQAPDNFQHNIFDFYGVEPVIKSIALVQNFYRLELSNFQQYLQRTPIFILKEQISQVAHWRFILERLQITDFEHCHAALPEVNKEVINLSLVRGELIISCFPLSLLKDIQSIISEQSTLQGLQLVIPSCYAIFVINKLVEAQYLPRDTATSLYTLHQAQPILFDGPTRNGLAELYSQLPSPTHAQRQFLHKK